MELVIAEKPSVAQSIAAVLGATQRKDGYLEGNGSSFRYFPFRCLWDGEYILFLHNGL